MHPPHAATPRRLLSRVLPALGLTLLLALVPMVAIGSGQGPVTIERRTPLIEAPGGNAILSVAMQAVGTYQGECFPWVRRVVQQATGRQMGFGYREGYLSAGAVEVSLAEAHGGDIIQLINDTNDGANADYAGMHTSIVLESSGGGLFRVVDSNLGFDGIVRMREGYNPMALAARYASISVHVYRFPAQGEALVGGSAPAGPSSTQLVQYTPGGATGASPQQVVATAIVQAQGDCLRMRSGPGMSSSVLTCLPDGSTVSLLQGSQQADGILWQLVSAAGQTGWVADQYLQRTSSTAPAPAATTSAPTPTAAPPSVVATQASDVAVVGDVPAAGGLALVVFSGGPVDSLLKVVSNRGCGLVSVWANRAGGGLVGMIPGAPALVNREWTSQYPSGALEGRTPLIIVCRGGALATVAPPPTSPASTSTVGRAPGPPGPAGNE